MSLKQLQEHKQVIFKIVYCTERIREAGRAAENIEESSRVREGEITPHSEEAFV